MASRAAALPFGIRIESGISTPSPAKVRQSQAHLDSRSIELPEFKSSSQDETVTTTREALTTESPITGEPSSELEQRPPPPGAQQNVVTIQPSFSYPRMNKFRVLAACMTYFGNGVNDSAPGALIPYLESWYDIGYAIVSLIFVTNAVGFIVSAFSNDAITARLGRAGALVLSETFMIAGYVVITCSPPFPAVVAAYLLLGFGNGLNLALNNVFCANLANSTVILGIASGSYGIGGILGPIIATALVSAGAHWSRFYIIAIAIRSTCLLLAAWSYKSYEKEPTSRITSSQPTTASSSSNESKSHLLLHTLKNKTTLIGALLIFAYQGAEVSESGWFISYLIDSRGADPKRVGYVTSGFWAGITVGRFVLTHATPYFGEKKFVFILGLGTVGFQIMAWFLPNVIGDSVAVAIIGLLLGPIYPCCTAVFSRLLPLNLQVSAIGFISSAGSSGGAVVPLITGLLAQAAGTWVLHPVCIVFYVVMLIAWALLPKVVKRDE